MDIYKMNLKKVSIAAVMTVLLSIFALHTQQTDMQQNPAAGHVVEGTEKVWGSVDGISFAGWVEGPSAAKSDLQVACLFEYTEGDLTNSPPALPAAANGMLHLDKALNGQITELRSTGRFKGRALETLLLTPQRGVIQAKRILLIGLGDRNDFEPEIMTSAGEIAAREALKLGVTRFAFASDLKDAGVDSPTALVAGNIVKGIVSAQRLNDYLKVNHLGEGKTLDTVYLLAGPAFFTTAGQGIQQAIEEVK